MRIYVKPAKFHPRSAQNGPWWLHCRWISPFKNLFFYFIFGGRFTSFGTQLIDECRRIYSEIAISTCRTTRQLRGAKGKFKECGGAAAKQQISPASLLMPPISVWTLYTYAVRFFESASQVALILKKINYNLRRLGLYYIRDLKFLLWLCLQHSPAFT